VPGQARSLPAQLARWLLDCAVRYWPEETRAWGMALAAEIDEATGTVETLRWSVGGIMFFAHSWAASLLSWLKLPAGAPLRLAREGGPRDAVLPRRSRLFTIGVLAATAAVLFLPQSREAISTVRASWTIWNERDSSSHDQRMIDRLAARAEKENDAPTLAFVALRVNDSGRFATLADRAVSLNPEFVWVYGAARSWPGQEQTRAKQLQRLQAADPANAAPKLLAADGTEKPTVESLYDHRSSIVLPSENTLAHYPQWVALMEQAFAAPRYDSYFQRHFQLSRDVWNRERSLPVSVVLYGLWFQHIPNLMDLRMFSDIRIHQARKAAAAGNLKEAEQLLEGLDSFGERMFNGSSTVIEKLIALAIARHASNESGELYQSVARTVDAQNATLRVQQIDERIAALHFDYSRQQRFRKWGFLVQGVGGLAVLAGCAALLAILLQEFWPARTGSRRSSWRKVVCWFVDYAPATLLVATGAFLLSFLPFAHVLAQFRSSQDNLLADRYMGDTLMSLASIPIWVLSAKGTVWIWEFVTAFLVGVALFAAARSIYRVKRVSPKPT